MQHENRRVVKREVKSEMEQLVDLVCEEARQNIKKFKVRLHRTQYFMVGFDL